MLSWWSFPRKTRNQSLSFRNLGVHGLSSEMRTSTAAEGDDFTLLGVRMGRPGKGNYRQGWVAHQIGELTSCS